MRILGSYSRHAVRRVLARFVGTAVARCRVGDSWDLAGPSLRQGVSRDEWRRGEIPIVPYPAARHGRGSWDLVNYSYRNRVGLEVLLFPRPGSGYSMATQTPRSFAARTAFGGWTTS
jgi:hypothetical protein